MTTGQIEITGAGMAGLTAALCFAAKGYSVKISEQAEALEEVGAGLQLSPNAMRILNALGLAEALDTAMLRPAAIVLTSGTTLAPISYVPAGRFALERWGAPYGVIHRADLQKILLDAVHAHPSCHLTLGHEVHPDEISGENCDFSVIADGVWSANRRRVRQAGQPAFTGLVAWRFTTDAVQAGKYLDPSNVTAFLGPDSHLVTYPVKGGKLVNMVAITTGKASAGNWSYQTSDENRTQLLERFSRWHPSLRKAMGEAERITYWPLYQLSDGDYFDGGKAALIGDAAHAMGPFAAQGAAMAIEDAWELAAAVPSGRPAVFEWEKARRARIARARNRAAFNRFAYHARGPVRLGRDMVLRLRKPEDLAADLDWLYGWRGTSL